MILTFDNFINFSSEVWQKPAFFKTFESKAFDLVHFHRTISYHTIDLYNQGERAFLEAITETSQRHISPKIQLLPLSPTPCSVKKPIWTCNQANLISKLGDGTFGKEGEITKINMPSQDTMQCKSGNDYKKLLLVAPSCALFWVLTGTRCVPSSQVAETYCSTFKLSSKLFWAQTIQAMGRWFGQ